MNFTRRTYRIAIRRSRECESHLFDIYQILRRLGLGQGARTRWRAQVNLTRKLQARKRRERK